MGRTELGVPPRESAGSLAWGCCAHASLALRAADRPSQPQPDPSAQPSDPNHSSSSSQHKPACSVSPRPLSRSTRQDPHLSRPLQTPKSSPGPLLCLSPLAPSAPRLAPLQPPPSPPGPPGRRRQPPTARPDDHQGGHAGRLHRPAAVVPVPPVVLLARRRALAPTAAHADRDDPVLPPALAPASSPPPAVHPPRSPNVPLPSPAIQIPPAAAPLRALAAVSGARGRRPRRRRQLPRRERHQNQPGPHQARHVSRLSPDPYADARPRRRDGVYDRRPADPPCVPPALSSLAFSGCPRL